MMVETQVADAITTEEVQADLVEAEVRVALKAKEVQLQEAVVSDQKLKEVLLQEVVDLPRELQEKVVLEAEEMNQEVQLQKLGELVVFHQKDRHVDQKELQTERQDVQKVPLINQEKEDHEEVNKFVC